MLSTPGYSAYLKIAEGCDHPCTFCVIPQMRGAFRSRRFASVIREAENLAQQGVRELTIVGQDTTSYGEDLGLRDGLPSLLRELGKIPDLVWVRFLYCYPNRVTDALIAAVAETPKVAKYFDIPLQHASCERPEADEARFEWQAVPAHVGENSRRHPRRRSADIVHRRLSRRDR